MSALLREAIGDYLLSGLQGGWSRATRDQYAWHLDRWRIWLDDRAIMRVDQVTRHLLRVWGASLRERWSPSTARIAVIAVRGFLRWCDAEGLSPAGLAGALKTPKVPRRVQRTMFSDEILALLNACKTPATAGLTHDQAAQVCLRNAAIVSLLYDSMLRNAELCRLRVQDVDLERRSLQVIIKGGDLARGRFGVETADRLRAWLDVRQAAPGVDTVFVSIGGATPGRTLTTSGLRIILRNLGKRAGLERVSPHAFRRGAAVRATQLGAPSRAVQQFARWSNIAMVELYTRAMDSDELYDEYSPVDSLHDEAPPTARRKRRK